MARLESQRNYRVPESPTPESPRNTPQPIRIFQSGMKAVRDRIRQHAVQTGDWPPPNAIFGSKQVSSSVSNRLPSSSGLVGGSHAGSAGKKNTINTENPSPIKRKLKEKRRSLFSSGGKSKPGNLHAMVANFRDGPATTEKKLPVLIESADGGLICPDTDMNTIIEGFMEFERHFKRGGLLPFANVMPISTLKSKSISQNDIDECTNDKSSETTSADNSNRSTKSSSSPHISPVKPALRVSTEDISTSTMSLKTSSLKNANGSSPNQRTLATTKKQVTFDHGSFPHKKKIRLKESTQLPNQTHESPILEVEGLPHDALESEVKDSPNSFDDTSPATKSTTSEEIEKTQLIDDSDDVFIADETEVEVETVTKTTESTADDQSEIVPSPVPLSPTSPDSVGNGDKIKGESLDANEIGDAIQKCLENLRLASSSYGALMMGGDSPEESSKKKSRVRLTGGGRSELASRDADGRPRRFWRRLLCLRSPREASARMKSV